MAKTEDIMDQDSSDEDDSDKLPLENCIENEIPVTLVSVQPRSQDYYLKLVFYTKVCSIKNIMFIENGKQGKLLEDLWTTLLTAC